MLAGLLLLADSRLPSGGHVHSGGVEAVVERGLLTGLEDLVLFLDGRVRTAGLVTAALAAAAATIARRPGPTRWDPWSHAADVRTPSPALRAASGQQGAALLRTASVAWPRDRGLAALRARPDRPPHPLALGAAATAAGTDPAAAAALAVHHLVGGAATAAVRLLGLDPLRVAAAQAELAPLADRVATEATGLAAGAVDADDPDLLPGDATVLADVLAELHHASEVTLFAS